MKKRLRLLLIATSMLTVVSLIGFVTLARKNRAGQAAPAIPASTPNTQEVTKKDEPGQAKPGRGRGANKGKPAVAPGQRAKRAKAPKEVELRVEGRAGGAEQKAPGGRGQDQDQDEEKQRNKPVTALATPSNEPPAVNKSPREFRLTKSGRSFDGDLRSLPYVKEPIVDRPERDESVGPVLQGDLAPTGSGLGRGIEPNPPAPAATSSFNGLGLPAFGNGYPPDTNGDVGPNHYIQTINTALGIFDKASGTQLVGLTFNTFMSQGAFGNQCDTNNLGDPVVLYDTFEDRWILTDFAFTVDSSGNISPQIAFQCFAASKTSDPVAGGWNYYSIQVTDGLNDYPKFGIWPDGLYMSANLFGFPTLSASFINSRVWALNKAQMYAGAPGVQIVSFDAPDGVFTLMPANARLQTGAPPVGASNYFAVLSFTNALSVYKFHVDWDNISLSTFTGPSNSFTTGGSPATFATGPASVPTLGGNSIQTLTTRLMMQNQYVNIGGVESVWNSHTVLGNASQASPRFYQVNVTGGTVAGTATQAATFTPDSTISRFMPSIAVDRMGNMALGYSASASTIKPAIRYAGQLTTDGVNVLGQTETSLLEGTGTQTNMCGGAACTRWGDYSAMSLDPDGCRFWYTTQYYAADGGNYQTRIGAFKFPSCTNVGAGGTVSGTVTATNGGQPISGAQVTLGNRTTTTNTSGVYSFTSIPAGTYPTIGASAAPYNPVSASPLTVTDGNTTTQNFSLGDLSASSCLTDTTQADFLRGVATTTDITTSPGDIVLSSTGNLDQQNTFTSGTGTGITNATWLAQTFVPAVSGQLTRVDLKLFCASCSGTVPTAILSVRATSAGVPGTGADLATANTVTSSLNASSATYSFNFPTPATLTAGTTYALVVRNGTNPTAGTHAVLRSATGSDVYANGTRYSSTTSGSAWTSQTSDIVFKTFMRASTTSGNLVSSVKDSNPASCATPNWTTISWNANTPAGTTAQFQAAGSNSVNGPFNFVGPDGTSGTFFTNGGSLSQFNGFRYLKYRAVLSSTTIGTTPTVNEVTVCYTNGKVWNGSASSDWNNAANWTPSGVPTATDTVNIPATGVTNNPVISAGSVTVAGIYVDSARTLTVNGSLTLTTNTCTTIKGTVNVMGSVSLGGTPTLTGSTFNFNGTGAQTLPSLSYNNITVNNAAGTSLSGNTTAIGTLTLTNGILDTGANTLNLTNCATGAVSGGSSASYVKGTVQRCVNTTGSYNFPVGDGGYTPVQISNAAGTGTFAANTVAAAPVATGLPSHTLNRTWNLTNSGLTSADVVFNYLDSDQPAGSPEAFFTAYRINGGAATNQGGTVSASNSVTVNGVSAFSPWTIGGNAPTGVEVTVSGGVRAGERVVSGASVMLSDLQGMRRKTSTNQRGRYQFEEVEAGRYYLLEVQHRSYRFVSRYVFIGGETNSLDFTASTEK